MMNSFIIVNIFPSPHVRDSLLDKTMLFPTRKSFPSPFSLPRNRIYLATHLKEGRANLF